MSGKIFLNADLPLPPGELVNMLPRARKPPTPEEIRDTRDTLRLPLDVARGRIYAIAREASYLLPKVFPDFDSFELLDGAPGLHSHLFSLCLDGVTIHSSNIDDTHVIDLEELHAFEDLFYITVIILHFFHTWLENGIHSGAVDPSENVGEGFNYFFLMDHIRYHSDILMREQLVAPLDFSVRRERLLKIKLDHNMGVFMKNYKYAHGQTEATMTNSIRNALDAVAFNETQLTPNIIGLHEHFCDSFQPAKLLECLYEKHAVALAGWCEMNGIQPQYELPMSSSDQTDNESSSSHFDEEDTFLSELPNVEIEPENMPEPEYVYTQPAPSHSAPSSSFHQNAANVIADWLHGTDDIENTGPQPITKPNFAIEQNIPNHSDSGYIDGEDDDMDEDDDYFSSYTDEEEMEADVDDFLTRDEPAHDHPALHYDGSEDDDEEYEEEKRKQVEKDRFYDPFFEHLEARPAARARARSKKRAAPEPIDVELANLVKKSRASPETGTEPASSLETCTIVGDGDDYILPRLRGGRNMSPLPTSTIRPGSLIITIPSETNTQHESGLALHRRFIENERERTLRALVGEATDDDLAILHAEKREFLADKKAWSACEQYVGYKKYW